MNRPTRISRGVPLATFLTLLLAPVTSAAPPEAGFVNVKLHGATGDGVTDDTAAFAVAIAAALGKVLYIPPGVYVITSTLTIDSDRSIIVAGAGPAPVYHSGSTLRWKGDATSPLLRLIGLRDSLFENFTILATPQFPLAVAIQSENGKGPRGAGRNIFRNLWINGVAPPGLAKGMAFVRGPLDINNDLSLVEKVRINNYAVAAVSIEHPQSLGHTFLDCYFTGPGPRGIATSLGPHGTGGSFRWISGMVGNHTVSDFELGATPGGTTLISAAHSEGSARFLVTTGATDAQYEVIIRDSYYAADRLHPDGRAIIYRYAGPFVFTGNRFGSSSNAVPLINLAPVGELRAVIFGNNFGSNRSEATDPILLTGAGPAKARVLRFSNVYRTGTQGFAAFRADDVLGLGTGNLLGTGAFTQSTLPPPAAAGRIARLTDPGREGLWIDDGTAWQRITPKSILTGTAALTFPPIAPQGCASLTVTVAGASDGDIVSLGLPGGLAGAPGVTFTGYVSAASTVTVKACNVGPTATPAPATATVRVGVWKP